MFRVGQKVTMIAPWCDGPTLYGEIFTQMGEVYTVRETLVVNGRDAIRVCEIRNRANYYEGHGLIEQPFPASNFRPVVERKTDIGWAHEILRKATKKKPAPISTNEIMRQFDAAIDAIRRA